MPREWSVKEIHDLVQEEFGKRPCWYQIKIALVLHAGKDVVGCAATGAGKTLSFWIALLMALADGENKMIFVVTPLNLLGMLLHWRKQVKFIAGCANSLLSVSLMWGMTSSIGDALPVINASMTCKEMSTRVVLEALSCVRMHLGVMFYYRATCCIVNGFYLSMRQ